VTQRNLEIMSDKISSLCSDLSTSSTSQNTRNNSSIREHSLKLYLSRKLSELKNLSNRMLICGKYFSRRERDLAKRALLFYKNNFNSGSLDVSVMLEALRASTRKSIDFDICLEISKTIELFLTEYSDILKQEFPENDDEIFDSLVDEEGLGRAFWIDLIDNGIVMSHRIPFTRQIELSGTNADEAFFDFITSKYNFEDPRRYFKYSGGVSTPNGKVE